jgi:hypothetical protein
MITIIGGNTKQKKYSVSFEILGTGAQGVVRKCTDLSNGR